MRICKKCNTTDRYASGKCKVCCRANTVAWNAANPNKRKASQAAWQKANPENYKANSAKWAAANPEKRKTTSAVWYKANSEKAKANGAAWRASNPEKSKENSAKWAKANPEKAKASRNALYKASPDKFKAYNAAWAKANREKRVASSLKWQKTNLEAVRTIHAARRARKNAAPGQHTAADIKALFVLQKGKCICCRVSLDDGYHVDHIYPLSKDDSSNDKYNLQLLCQPCNNQKSAKDPITFMQSRGFLI